MENKEDNSNEVIKTRNKIIENAKVHGKLRDYYKILD